MSRFDEVLRESEKSMRMWSTWKLQVPSRDVRGEDVETIWDRMSKDDRDFNLVWNELYVICRDMSLPKLKRILAAAKLIERS